MSGKAIATKSLKEKWLSIVQSAEEKGEKGIGGSSIVTWLEFAQDVTFKHAKENALFTLHVLMESSFPLHMDSGL